MSDLSGQADDYLRLRRALGHNLDDVHRLLPRFVAYLDTSAPRRSPSKPPWRGPAAPTRTRRARCGCAG